MPFGIGHALHGKYRLLRLLGDGGMGAVYEATHIRLGTRIAIKVLHPELTSRPHIVERFLQEARISAQIRSPHVVQVIDVDQSPEGHAYMVMELLEGETLLHLLERERKLSTAVACAFTLQVLEGLEAAHALGVVHRDLKPENVFVSHGTQKTVVKLIDFGIAKVRREGSAGLTMAGVTMGTAEYMAPEQAFSADRADGRSDLFAVGVMLYEMLSGTRPIEGDDPREIATKVERGEIKPLVHALPSVPPALAGFAHRAMAARPEMRFQSAAEMRLALDRLVGHDAGETLPIALVEPPSVKPPDPQPRPVGPSTLRGTPIEQEPYVPPPPFDSLPPPPVRSSALPLIAMALLLGIGAVVALALAQQSHAASPAASASGGKVSASSSLAAITPASAQSIDEPLPTSLKPLSNRPLATSPRGAQKVDAAAPPATTKAAPTATDTTPPFPTGIPLPFPPTSMLPLPSAIPTDILP